MVGGSNEYTNTLTYIRDLHGQNVIDQLSDEGIAKIKQ